MISGERSVSCNRWSTGKTQHPTNMKSDVCVQSTNDFSALSKASASALGYFQDTFQKYFVSRACRRSPLIHRGYYVRSQAVGLCLQEFLQDTQGSPHIQVLSLGCGSDSLYFRLCGEQASEALCVWEVDFPAVVRRKSHLIEQTEALRDLLGSYEINPTTGEQGGLVLSAQHYKLLGVDLSDVSGLEAVLENAGFRWDCPSLILAEVVLCYMDPARSTALIGWAANRFGNARFVLYEQFGPDDPFGRVMMSHFVSLNSTLHSVTVYPHLHDQRKRFLQEGWVQCRVMDMNEFTLTTISDAESQRLEALEPFDEFEEFHLKCSHYFILVASSGSLADTPVMRHKYSDTAHSPTLIPCASLLVYPLPETLRGMRRFGHRSCYVSSDVIVTTGGFGEGGGKHQRLTDIHLLRHGGETCDTETTVTKWDGRLLHTLTPLSGGGGILVLGGRLSPSRAAIGALILTYEESTQSMMVVQRDLQPEILRWRHTATEVSLCDQFYVFIFGGRSVASKTLQGPLFLHPQSLSSVEIPIVGSSPSGRHSHSSSAWSGGAVISGGLLSSGAPSGSIALMRPLGSRFQWEKLTVTPPLTPRYSHSSHVVGNKLLLVGGVWMLCDSVPGLAIIDLTTGHCAEYQINTSLLEWPLMLHGHSSVVIQDRRHLLLLGGGGTCFSFGTHFNSQPVLLELPRVL